MTTLHIFRATTIKRVRIKCPYCGHFCYGTRHDYYDGCYFFLECGVHIDSEGWKPPKKKKCLYCRKWFRPKNMIKHLREYHKIISQRIKER